MMLGKIEGRRRRGWKRMRLLDGITDSMDMRMSKLGCWWLTGKPGMLQSMGLHTVGHDWVTELNWTASEKTCKIHIPLTKDPLGKPKDNKWNNARALQDILASDAYSYEDMWCPVTGCHIFSLFIVVMWASIINLIWGLRVSCLLILHWNILD